MFFVKIHRLLPSLLLLCLAVYATHRIYTVFFPAQSVTRKTAATLIVENIETLGKLELVRYQLSDVSEYTKKRPFPVTDDRIMLVISGEAVGCIDLEKISVQDIHTQGDTVFVTLPDPEICHYRLNHQKSKVYDMTFTKLFDKTDLIEEAFKMAEARVLALALETDILEQTRTNAALVLRPLLESVSGKTVILDFGVSGPKLWPVER